MDRRLDPRHQSIVYICFLGRRCYRGIGDTMDWLTIADHSITDIVRRNFPDLTVTLQELVVMLSDANLAKTSPPLCIGQCSVKIRPNFG